MLSSLRYSITELLKAILKVDAVKDLTKIAPIPHIFNELLEAGLVHTIYLLYLYRVAADHHILNPTKVELTTKPWKGMQESIEINYGIVCSIRCLKPPTTY